MSALYDPEPESGPPPLRPRTIVIAFVAALLLFLVTAAAASAAVPGGNPAADLDQCANGPAPSPPADGCTAEADWVNGNVNQSKASYYEGDSLPYRMRFSNLSTSGSHTVTIEWDTTQGGKHALDYLTTWNRTVTTADPCLGVTGCVLGSPTSTFAIPADPQVTGNGVSQIPGVFTMWGGTITGVSAYSGGELVFPDGNNARKITITFTASVDNPVLAWSAHIASREDWGAGNSAVAISGSPYHTRLLDLDGAGGNQDRALSASAVIFPGSIEIVKDAIPDGDTEFPFTAGPAPLADFTLVDDGTASNTRLFDGIVDFTTYSVTEETPSGWVLEGVECTVQGGLSTTPPSTTTATVDITLQEGDQVSCTYTNQSQGQLHLRKVVVNDNGGSAAIGDFTLTATGTIEGNVISGAGSADSDTSFEPDTFTLSESGPSGYSASAWECDGGIQNGDEITVATGEDVTCTITNDDQPPVLHLRKVVVNDNGGTIPDVQFPLSATGTIEGNAISGSTPVDSGVSLKADTFTLAETTQPGYSASAWSCVEGDGTAEEPTPIELTGDGADQLALGNGQEATCTITNDDIAPMLHLRKVVVNDNGGTATVADFPLAATGTLKGNVVSGTSPVDSGAGLLADAFTLSETPLDGYTASAWDCVEGDGTAEKPTPIELGGDNADVLTLGIGAEATCTITNDDVAPSLTLVKKVVNDNGGTAEASDFTLTATGTVEGNVVTGAGGATSSADLVADTFALSETTMDGYSASDWVCEGGTQDGASIAVGIGEDATCTITNDDAAPGLTLVKKVVNDNGGTAVATDFTLTATGTVEGNVVSGKGGATSSADLVADTFTLSETTVDGYTAGAWVCVGGKQVEDTIAVATGEDVTCTITNDDKPPVLHLRKVVINDNGGTTPAVQFPLSAKGTIEGNGISGSTPVDSGVSLKADTFTLAEKEQPGYTASAWSCVEGDGTAAEPKPIELTGAGADQLALGNGQEATCTITNDDIAPSLTLVKKVVNDNGGTAVATDFTLTATGTVEGNVVSGKGGASSSSDLVADTFALSETAVDGYSASDWVCEGGTQDGASIAVGIGQKATCTITNDDVAPVLHLRKVVVNDNGGTATVADFPLAATGTLKDNVVSGTSPVDSGAGLLADAFTLSETPLDGYTASAWSCVEGDGTAKDPTPIDLTGDNADVLTLGIGAEATCTITNDDVAPSLTLVKKVVNDNGGTAVATDFTLTATGTVEGNIVTGAGGASSSETLTADTFALSEAGAADLLAGYEPGAWICNGDGTQEGGSITLGLGDAATCTITNDDRPPVLHLRKVVDSPNGGGAVTADFTLSATGTIEGNVLTGTSPVDSGPTLSADTFTLSETTVDGYAASPWACVEGDGTAEEPTPIQLGGDNADQLVLGNGVEATCTVVNTDEPLELRLRKVVVNDNGGTAVPADFTLTATGTREGNVVTGAGSVDSEGLLTDTFTLSETGPAGYAAGAWVCDGGTQEGSAITVGLGQIVTCTITNDDIAPVLQLRKAVVNNDGGTAVPADFSLSATGTIAGNAVSGAGSADSGPGLVADTFALAETGPAGYAASGWVCVGGTQNGAAVTVGVGQTATCTITNDDVPVIAPPTPPVIAPPPVVRGTAVLAGPRGCVSPGVVTTRVSGRNIASVRFYRDGRLVKRVTVGSSRLRTVTLRTRIAASDFSMHMVVARVRFTAGSTPATRVLTHRFGQCAPSVVTG